MPVEMAVWRLGARGPERVHPTRIETERSLKDAIGADLSLIDDGLMLLGRQVTTAHGKYADLLAIDEEGTVHVIELKRDRTPRAVVAQVPARTCRHRASAAARLPRPRSARTRRRHPSERRGALRPIRVPQISSRSGEHTLREFWSRGGAGDGVHWTDRTPRAGDTCGPNYGSWVQDLGHDQVRGIFRDQHPGQEFDAAFGEAFGTAQPEELNESHRLAIVASDLDPAPQECMRARIIGYLSKTHGVPVNAVFFRHFEDGDSRFLMRSWFIEPSRAEARAEKQSSRRRREPWNGRDFYVAFGDGKSRNWEDARRYGFVSAGGGAWYSKSLHHLLPGHRIFVHVPGNGYVGVGTVTEPAVPARDSTVRHDGHTIPYADAPLDAPDPLHHLDDPEMSEHLVRVDWIAAVPIEEAHWEKGLFANQNSACKLRSQFTIERVSGRFGVGE